MTSRARLLRTAAALGVFAGTLLAPGASRAIDVVDGLAGYWPADGHALDASGKGNHGALQGGATFAPGRVGQAFLLDGVDDFVLVAASSDLDATGPFSIVAWVRRDTTGVYHTVVDRGLGLSDPESSYTLRLENDDEVIFEWEQNGTNLGVTSGELVTDGAWHHVAGVFDGDNSTVYLDGEVANSVATALTPTVAEQGLQIGARRRDGSPTFDLFFEGRIDEVGFYDRALTSDEVALLAAADEPVPALPPAALAALAAGLLLASQRCLGAPRP